MFKRRDRSYTSDNDQFLHTLNNDPAESSPAVAQEVEKAARVTRLRDDASAVDAVVHAWDDF